MKVHFVDGQRVSVQDKHHFLKLAFQVNMSFFTGQIHAEKSQNINVVVRASYPPYYHAGL